MSTEDIPTDCEWCHAPLPEAGPVCVNVYDPDGSHLEARWLCSNCHQYGPPMSSRRDRVEWAWKIEPQMSRLEKLGWKLIRRANR